MLILQLVEYPHNSIKISGDTISLGTNVSNSFVVDHPSISGLHCELAIKGSHVLISDLASTAGTFVNERRISSGFEIHAADIIRMGQIELEVIDDRQHRPDKPTNQSASEIKIPSQSEQSAPYKEGSRHKNIAVATLCIIRSPSNIKREKNPLKGQQFALYPGSYSVGRNNSNDIVLSEPSISPCHAQLICSKGNLEIDARDPNASLLLNGQKQTHATVCHGDLIKMGNIEMVFLIQLETTDAPAESIPHHQINLRNGNQKTFRKIKHHVKKLGSGLIGEGHIPLWIYGLLGILLTVVAAGIIMYLIKS